MLFRFAHSTGAGVFTPQAAVATTHTQTSTDLKTASTFRHATFVFGVRMWTFHLFLAIRLQWISKRLHYYQENLYQHMQQRTMKTSGSSFKANTFSGVTQWHEANMSLQGRKYSSTTSGRRRNRRHLFVYSPSCEMTRDRIFGVRRRLFNIRWGWRTAEVKQKQSGAVCLCNQVTQVKQHLAGPQCLYLWMPMASGCQKKMKCRGFLLGKM